MSQLMTGKLVQASHPRASKRGDGTPAELSARVSREDGGAGIGAVLRSRAYRRE